MEEEFVALDTPPFAARGAVTDEYLRAFKELWTSDDPTFEGEYCRFSNLSFLPKPVQKPHPPIWVGGQSRRAIRRAAELGDAWHPVGAIPAASLEPEELAADVSLMRRYAERAGRDPATVGVALKAPLYDPGVTTGGTRRRFGGSAEQVLQDIQTYADLGVGHLILDFRAPGLAETLERMEWFAQEVMAKA
jgi:alkanesulfonate monooxygenase SsuD/methylene tetrahydromethanopterin reductase-like flavin-dependent oxidoreductase (luciferase family)